MLRRPPPVPTARKRRCKSVIEISTTVHRGARRCNLGSGVAAVSYVVSRQLCRPRSLQLLSPNVPHERCNKTVPSSCTPFSLTTLHKGVDTPSRTRVTDPARGSHTVQTPGCLLQAPLIASQLATQPATLGGSLCAPSSRPAAPQRAAGCGNMVLATAFSCVDPTLVESSAEETWEDTQSSPSGRRLVGTRSEPIPRGVSVRRRLRLFVAGDGAAVRARRRWPARRRRRRPHSVLTQSPERPPAGGPRSPRRRRPPARRSARDRPLAPPHVAAHAPGVAPLREPPAPRMHGAWRMAHGAWRARASGPSRAQPAPRSASRHGRPPRPILPL
jgi:hypothetical protein